MADFKQIFEFSIQKANPQEGDLIMITMPHKHFDDFSPDVLNQLATDLQKGFPNVKIFFASKDYNMKHMNKTQLQELGLQRIK